MPNNLIMEDTPNKIDSKDMDARQEGLIDAGGDVLTLDLDDQDIVQIIGTRVSDSEDFWNKELNLDNVRKENEKYYLNLTYNEKDLYEWQVPYKNNRIITAVETLVPLAVSQPAEPIVTEASDSDESRQLASDLGNVLFALYEDLYIKAKLSMIGRHLLTGKRVAILKYRFDPNLGKVMPDGSRKGAIVVEVVRPEKVVFEQKASDPGDIPLIAEYMEDTLEDLVAKFPDKKDEMFKKQGIKQGTKKQLAAKIGYLEVWFSYRDKEGNVQEGVCWKWGNLILDKMQNPNWNYDLYYDDPETGEQRSLNFHERPMKPYIIFNHLNLGKYVIDDTSLLEQAKNLQDILNKRGRQIVENADQATSGLVLDENKISQEDAKKIIGDPSEKVMVDGRVDQAATRLPYNPLPNYVVEDKFDARAEIDNVFGTNAPVRGESSGLDTLGEVILSQRANIGRLQTLSDSIEDGMDRLYKALVQMMKVYWDEPEILRYRQVEGKTEFIEWDRNKIEDGVDVRVKAGTALPKDKFALRNETIQMMAVLDPLSIAEGLDKSNPKEWAKRIIYYRFFMDKYLTEFLNEGDSEVDSKALGDIQALMNGQVPEIPESVSQEYLLTFEKFLTSEGFKAIEDPAVKQRIVEFAKAIKDKAKEAIGEAPESTEASPVTQGEAGGAGVGVEGAPVAPAGQGEQQNGSILSRGVQALLSRIQGQ